MKRTLFSLIASLALAGGATGAFAHERSDLSMKDLPPPVQDSVQREAQSNRVADLHKTIDSRGKEVFKAEIQSGTRKTDLTIARDGTVISRRTHRENAERSNMRE